MGKAKSEETEVTGVGALAEKIRALGVERKRHGDTKIWNKVIELAEEIMKIEGSPRRAAAKKALTGHEAEADGPPK